MLSKGTFNQQNQEYEYLGRQGSDPERFGMDLPNSNITVILYNSNKDREHIYSIFINKHFLK